MNGVANTFTSGGRVVTRRKLTMTTLSLPRPPASSWLITALSQVRERAKQSGKGVWLVILATMACVPGEPPLVRDACDSALNRTVELATQHGVQENASPELSRHQAQIKAAVGPRFLEGCRARTEEDREVFSACIEAATSLQSASQCDRPSARKN